MSFHTKSKKRTREDNIKWFLQPHGAKKFKVENYVSTTRKAGKNRAREETEEPIFTIKRLAAMRWSEERERIEFKLHFEDGDVMWEPVENFVDGDECYFINQYQTRYPGRYWTLMKIDEEVKLAKKEAKKRWEEKRDKMMAERAAEKKKMGQMARKAFGLSVEKVRRLRLKMKRRQ